MKELLTAAGVLAALFASTFLLIKATGWITVDDIKYVLHAASNINPLYVALAVVVLLTADLFIAIPTLTVSVLAGYFLGFPAGGASAATGMLVAGILGYILCFRYGPNILLKIYKDPVKLKEMQTIFEEHGTTVLLLCRAMPILPEVSCCLAGANRMPVFRFLAFYGIATIPYAFIAAYAGSASTLSDPKPAILTAVGISVTLWLAWLVFLRKNYRTEAQRSR